MASGVEHEEEKMRTDAGWDETMRGWDEAERDWDEAARRVDGARSIAGLHGKADAPPPDGGLGARESLDGRAINDPCRCDGVGNSPERAHNMLGTRRFFSVGRMPCAQPIRSRAWTVSTTNRRMSRRSLYGDAYPSRPSADCRNPLSLTGVEANKMTREQRNGRGTNARTFWRRALLRVCMPRRYLSLGSECKLKQ